MGMDLADIRGRIDDIDQQLLELFCQRMNLAAAAGAAKWRQGLPFSDQKRENEIAGWAMHQAGQEMAPYARQFFACLIAIAKDYQVQRAGLDRLPSDNSGFVAGKISARSDETQQSTGSSASEH